MITIFLIVMLTLALILLFVITSAFLGFLLTRVPFVPTYASDVEFFVKELGITSRDVFYDLGSGDGKVVFLVNRLTGARCVGYELTWWTHLLAKIKAKFYYRNFSELPPSPSLGVEKTREKRESKDVPEAKNSAPSFFQDLSLRKERDGVSSKNGGVEFKNQNFFKHPWTEANYIYGYLYPPLMGRVEEKFLADCKPGSIAIIRDFPFPHMKPEKIYYRPKKHEIYIYKKL